MEFPHGKQNTAAPYIALPCFVEEEHKNILDSLRNFRPDGLASGGFPHYN
ncbi:MAG: hypothetical protein ACI4PV_09620 [Butyricicoccus sp.]